MTCLVVNPGQVSQVGVVWEDIPPEFDGLQGFGGGQVLVQDQVGQHAARRARQTGKTVDNNFGGFLKSYRQHFNKMILNFVTKTIEDETM